MKRKSRLFRIIVTFVSLVLIIAISVLLVLWTKSIRERKEGKKFRDTLSQIVNSYGERGLLEMAGVVVNNIYYTEDGVTILAGNGSEWLYSADEMINMSVYGRCNSAVVFISTKQSESVSDFLDISTGNGVGTGFFISEDGYILTNKHVIDNAQFISIKTSDSQNYDAVVIGTDDENDIAVLKISDKNKVFPYLEFADSDDLMVGQKVIALGNPYGYDRSMSCGVVSGLSRSLRNEEGKVLLGMIQTDASINPGNSGGPLLDSRGYVVGLCTSIYTSSGASQGLNFAVDGNSAKLSAQDIIRYGKVNRGWLDIVPVQLSSQIVEYASLKVDSGILVSQVVPQGKADKAGIRGGNSQVLYGNSVIYLGGDIITSVNGYEVKEYSDLFTALSKTRPGDKIQVTVNRNGVSKELKVELVERTTENVGWINR